MERKVLWNKPVTDHLGRVSYTSKCGRYRIEKKHYERPKRLPQHGRQRRKLGAGNLNPNGAGAY